MCFKGLPDVFNPNTRPWVHIEGASTQQIIDQVEKCPSGALSYYLNDEDSAVGDTGGSQRLSVEVTPNGPLMIQGELKITMSDGSVQERSKMTAFCRCGESQNKPFCDGTHKKNQFKG